MGDLGSDGVWKLLGILAIIGALASVAGIVGLIWLIIKHVQIV